MNAGEIGAAAGRIFNYKAPLSWIIRSQEDQDDLGIDCEIDTKILKLWPKLVDHYSFSLFKVGN